MTDREVPRLRFFLAIAALAFWGPASPARAETIELVTYYPSPGGQNVDTPRLHARAATVGPPYSLTNPATLDDGILLVSDRLGIGPGFVGGTLPAGSLHVVGPANQADRALFMPGGGTGTMRVGIGTENPGNPLEVAGVIEAQHAVGFEGQQIQIGTMTPLGAPSIGFLTNIRAPGVNLFSNSMAARGGVILFDAGQGKLWFSGNRASAAQDATFDPFSPGNNIMVMDTSTGNVGIGTANPQVRLEVQENNAIHLGGAYLSGGSHVTGGVNSLAHFAFNAWFDGTTWRYPDPNAARIPTVLQFSNGQIGFFHNPSRGQAGFLPRLVIPSTGNVGIGTAAPQVKLEVAAGTTTSAIRLGDMYLSNGWWGYKAYTDGGTHYFPQAGLPKIMGMDDDKISFWHNTNRTPGGWAQQMSIYSNGNVDIGPGWGTAPAYRLNVQGSFAATSKNFEIDHPMRPGYKLVHSTLEGPETAVFYRGEGRLTGGKARVTLPDYFEALTRKGNRTVQLTAKGPDPYPLSCSNIENGQFTVHGTRPDGEFHWEVKAIRADVPPLEVERPLKE